MLRLVVSLYTFFGFLARASDELQSSALFVLVIELFTEALLSIYGLLMDSWQLLRHVVKRL